MAFSAIGFGVGTRFVDENKKMTITGKRCFAAGVITDAIAVPALIAIGIIGALGLLSLPPAASYTMIGLGATFALTHIAAFIFIGIVDHNHNPFVIHAEALASLKPQPDGGEAQS